jgi:predicted nucleic acid-binding protein
MMLLDSDVILCAAQPEHGMLRRLIAEQSPAVSAVSMVEVLGFAGLTETDRQQFEAFFAAATVLPVSEAVVAEAIKLRQQYELSLGSSLLAATALVNGHALVTRNTEDYDGIAGLELVNPFEGTSGSTS